MSIDHHPVFDLRSSLQTARIPFAVGAIAGVAGVQALQPIILALLAILLLIWLALPWKLQAQHLD